MTTLFFVTQKHPDFWHEPDRFDPDRFGPEHSAGRPAEAWCPFGLGGRRCIGEDFALMEATVAIATLAQRLELRLEPGAEVTGQVHGIGPLRPASGISRSVHSRTWRRLDSKPGSQRARCSREPERARTNSRETAPRAATAAPTGDSA